ncbi:hypothetical protein DEO72_LG7g1478 [Vigna unguiculata]|uniref:Uncharacterized protein n=1 Tax=Vigna unguiculata TaxID=3917 RepID=A0A4D6MHK7_VIGUN|nr:hypothetical protein DEO72_LG7g1478 [Vigna unguiculata]
MSLKHIILLKPDRLALLRRCQALRFQIAWWGMRAAWSVAPLETPTLQTLSSGTTLTTKRTRSRSSLTLPLSPGEPPTLPSATRTRIPLFCSYCLAGQTPPPGATPILSQYWFIKLYEQLTTPTWTCEYTTL